ncbi:peptide deformylase [Veronia nyctiphanis]|uniref:Peptide deformylase n=1 Tax=Veronia nyctiphanis TaxID=1278244 RepID=A0A4Q0YJ23_9GAMM|nr:peptide deformylase [Veronia nyctiphanis]RXJ70413.1 peptide deformylase [Veronia nyctiphanis]
MEIAQLGNPVLRQQALSLSHEKSDEYKAFFRDLESIMLEHNGVGIAAPQVSESIRAFIVASRPNARYPHAPMMQPTLMLNPEVIYQNDDIEMDWEGCLSIPGIRAKVPRSTEISVRYETISGECVEKTLSGFVARVFLHELDHLNGVVFLDRTESSEYVTEAEFQRIMSVNTPTSTSNHLA